MNTKLLEILVCPLCKGSLEHQDNELICKHDQLAFPISDGIPLMLIESARPLTVDNA